MDNNVLEVPAPLVGPDYNIYRYTDQIYKIVHFKVPRVYGGPDEVDRSRKGAESKIAPAISRAKRVVLELALCNSWEWFGTFTLDKEKYDRFNLQKFYKDFSQWLRDQRKKTGCSVRYVLIPELHADGAWHLHGLLAGLPALVSFDSLARQGWRVPLRLIDGGYSCWVDYHNKFGFCSLGAIRNPVACAFYVSKYVGKSFDDSGMSVGGHLYRASQGLARAVYHESVYGWYEELNDFCSNKYDFVETGFTSLKDGLDWSFGLEYLKIDPLEPDPMEVDQLTSMFDECLGVQQSFLDDVRTPVRYHKF